MLGLDVSVHNAPIVHMLEGKGYSGNIKPPYYELQASISNHHHSLLKLACG